MSPPPESPSKKHKIDLGILLGQRHQLTQSVPMDKCVLPPNPLYSHVNWGKTKILTPPVCIEPFPFALPVRGPEPEQFYTCHGPGSDPVSRSDKQTM